MEIILNLHRASRVGKRAPSHLVLRGTSQGRAGGRWGDTNSDRDRPSGNRPNRDRSNTRPGVEVVRKEANGAVVEPKFGPVVFGEAQGELSCSRRAITFSGFFDFWVIRLVSREARARWSMAAMSS